MRAPSPTRSYARRMRTWGVRGIGAGAAALLAGIVLLVALSASVGAKPGPGGPPCHIKKQTTKSHVPTVVGEMNMAYAGGKATFTYGQGADSDISTAVSIAHGPFEIDGTKHVSESSTSTGSFTRKGPYARQVVGAFSYQRTKESCMPDRFHPSRLEVHIEPVSWEGSITPGRKLPKTINHCRKNGPYTVKVAPGYVFTTSTETATTWNKGVTVFGVGLHSQSGFSTQVVETLRFPKKKGKYYLCGSDGPPATASRIFTGLG